MEEFDEYAALLADEVLALALISPPPRVLSADTVIGLSKQLPDLPSSTYLDAMDVPRSSCPSQLVIAATLNFLIDPSLDPGQLASIDEALIEPVRKLYSALIRREQAEPALETDIQPTDLPWLQDDAPIDAPEWAKIALLAGGKGLTSSQVKSTRAGSRHLNEAIAVASTSRKTPKVTVQDSQLREIQLNLDAIQHLVTVSADADNENASRALTLLAHTQFEIRNLRLRGACPAGQYKRASTVPLVDDTVLKNRRAELALRRATSRGRGGGRARNPRGAGPRTYAQARAQYVPQPNTAPSAYTATPPAQPTNTGVPPRGRGGPRGGGGGGRGRGQ